MERRERTRQLIGLGGLIAKAGLADETTAVLLGLLLDAQGQLAGPDGERLRLLWNRRGDRAFKADDATKADS
ncbi:conjugal transfer protein TraD [Telmatospirillum sp.]|uniref:conjugal transfer protein TraD n=1 Tax=Telmatospirillum sp. TaxID=2079197 RepID=UPI00284EE8D6|nr:conjugal transfer protein TraD [Telmatospirillum sp.]MDR3440572.1 conjugal transfer protein TraD [Telmatospirillum sp.]